MEFLFKFAALPDDAALLGDLDAAAARLAGKLTRLDLDAAGVSDYIKRYARAHVAHLRQTLQRYTYLLAWALTGQDTPPADLAILDYGGGCGILSMLAKEAGLGTVVYTDIYDVSCRDARTLARAVGCEAEHYVEGDINTIIGFAQKNRLRCDAVVSYDVLEHIYDVEAFLRRLGALSSGRLTAVLASAANPVNPKVVRRLQAGHREREFNDRERTEGHKERDALRAYLSARKEIIAQHAPALSPEEVDRLASATRELIKADIEACVDAYVATGRIPRQPGHPTNTCDPYTGNWAEHLMDLDVLTRALAESGFRVRVLGGYHTDTEAAVIGRRKRFERLFQNLLVSGLGRRGLRFAPFFTLYATRTAPVLDAERAGGTGNPPADAHREAQRP